MSALAISFIFLLVAFLRMTEVPLPASRLVQVVIAAGCLLVATFVVLRALRVPFWAKPLTNEEYPAGLSASCPRALAPTPRPVQIQESNELAAVAKTVIVDQAKMLKKMKWPERREGALRLAAMNQQRFHVPGHVLTEMVQRVVHSKGKEWVEIKTIDEIRLIAGEPWVFLERENVEIAQSLVVLNLLGLSLWMTGPTHDDVSALVGEFGRSLINPPQRESGHVTVC
ncbi:MAG: hypothetical protein ACYDH9_14135 [Limisphaerales bacterium]